MKKKIIGSYEYVKSKFTKYLDESNKRKTLDRFAILEEAYYIKGHFDIDMLYNKMQRSKFRVSRATLYNTLSLLIDCGFVIKYQFPNNDIKYEFVFNKDEIIHYHIFNLDTNEVSEFSDYRIEKIIKDVEKRYDIIVDNCSFILYSRSRNKSID